MKPWPLVVVGGALLAIAGCRSDPAIPILERQLRLQEDEIYRLRAALDQGQDCDSCSERVVGGPRWAPSDEAEPGRGRRRRGPAAPSGVKPPPVEMPSQSTSEVPDILRSPAGSSPQGVPEVPENLRGPSQPIRPRENAPGGRSSRPPLDHGMSPSPLEPNGPMLKQGMGATTSRPGHVAMASQLASAVPFTPAEDSRRVAAIVLNRQLTGGIGSEASGADQGLLVVVEPRDRAGRTVDAPAEMSVVAIDPALEGNAARVARWDFTVAETAAMFRRSGSTRAIHLTTAWPADPPAHHKLHLFVRYVTADGRKLQADMPVEVALSGDKTTRWNPSERAADRGQAADAWQRNEAPTARIPGPAPQMAARPDPPGPRRPVWSPERP
jgi:hypothetical protein